MSRIPHKCPICLGKCNVPSGFYDGVEFTTGSSSVPPKEPCKTCQGTGIVWDPFSWMEEFLQIPQKVTEYFPPLEQCTCPLGWCPLHSVTITIPSFTIDPITVVCICPKDRGDNYFGCCPIHDVAITTGLPQHSQSYTCTNIDCKIEFCTTHDPF